MSIELHREAPLFDSLLKIQMCEGATESRTTPLAFRIIPGTRSLPNNSQPERLYHFEVSLIQCLCLLLVDSVGVFAPTFI